MPHFKAFLVLLYKGIKVRTIYNMAYQQMVFRFKNSNEYEYYFLGEFGAKGEKRAKRRKKTKEEIARANQLRKEKNTRRLIKANFSEKDYWVTLKYPAGTRISIDEVKDDKKYFLKEMRKKYKKHGCVLKWICRLEIGAKGGIHIHIIVNRIKNADTDVCLQECWDRTLAHSFKRRGRNVPNRRGYVDYELLYDSGDYEALAKYITKKPEKDSEEYEQLSLFEKEEQKTLQTVTTSKNLIRPEAEKKDFSHRTVRRMIKEGPTPTPGYYIVQDSIQHGINPFTGYSYLMYTEKRINPIKTGHQPNRERGIP